MTTLAPLPAHPKQRPIVNLLGKAGEPLRERLFRWMLLFCLAVGLVTLVVLLTYIVIKGWPRLDSRLVHRHAVSISPETAGAQSAITGTLWIMVFTALWSLPVGILAAIYLEEYANPNRWWNRLIEINMLNLAAVPSIVFGILGSGVHLTRARIRPDGADGFTDPGAAGAARRSSLPAARRSEPSPSRSALGSLALGATQVADHLAAGAPGRDTRHVHRRDPGAVTGDR